VTVTPNFNPASIQLAYFEPDNRTKYFEPGPFMPLRTGNALALGAALDVPPLGLVGSAIVTLKESAELIAVREKFADPLLVYREAGLGETAVFASAVPSTWADSSTARTSVGGWVEALFPYSARDRYDFDVRDRGDALEIRVGLVDRGAGIPHVTALTASIDLHDGRAVPVDFRADPEVPGAFAATVILPRAENAQHALLSLRETGTEALARPQRIPLIVPPVGDVDGPQTSEDYTSGLNASLLRQIADASYGQFDPTMGSLRPAISPPDMSMPLWPWLTILSVLSYLAAVVAQRLDD
jgi:hypothetical protein